MEITPIAYARNSFQDKFGIPRQSREDSCIETHICFEKAYSDPNCLRGIDEYSHLWLIWGFTKSQGWSPTVRPPRLGGNTRVGVYATRAPYRPNSLGLSSVRLLRIEEKEKDGKKQLELVVSGADLLDGTPIYDIKPYLSFTDSHPESRNGFSERTKDYRLPVKWLEDFGLNDQEKKELTEILSQDPHPSYQTDSERIYILDYAHLKIRFMVCPDGLNVIKVTKNAEM